MTNDTVPSSPSEVNRDSSVNGEKSYSGKRLFLEWCQQHGLRNVRGNIARKPAPRADGYYEGKWVRLEPSGLVVYIDKDGKPTESFEHQPDDITRNRLIRLYSEVTAPVVALSSANHKIHRCKEAEDDRPLPKHVARRRVYRYPARGNPSQTAMFVIREDYTEEYVEARQLGRGDAKQCIPWIPVGSPAQPDWIYEFPQDKDWKTPLYWSWDGVRPGPGNRVVILEGEQAVDAWAAAARDKDHPWRTFLAEWEPICWQGGARPSSVLRADWALINRPDVEVLIWPDNDNEGYDNAAHIIWTLLTEAKSVHMMHFDGTDLPKHWDIADPVPMNSGKPVLTLVQLSGLMRLCMPAFTAREYVDDDGKAKVAYDLRPEFTRRFVRAVVGDGKHPEIVEIGNPFCRQPPAVFNEEMSGCDNRKGRRQDGLAQLMQKSGRLQPVVAYGVRPGGHSQHGRWIFPPAKYRREDGKMVLNLYVPPAISEVRPRSNTAALSPDLTPTLAEWGSSSAFAKAQPKLAALYLKTLRSGGKWGTPQDVEGRKVGRWLGTEHIRPFLAYMRHTFPNPLERKLLIQWLCVKIVARSRDEQVPWGPLSASERQGTGKTTFNEIFATLAGWRNCTKIRSQDLKSEHNGWLEGKIAIIIEELKENDNWDLYEKMKPLTDETVTIRRMYADIYTTPNMASLIGSTNHTRKAIQLPDESDNERRMFIPTVTELVGPAVQSDKPEPMQRDLVGFFWRYLGDPDIAECPFDKDHHHWFWPGVRRVMSDSAGGLLWFVRRYGERLRDKEVWPYVVNEPKSRLPRRAADGTPLSGRMWVEFYNRAPNTEAKQKMAEASKYSGKRWLEQLLEETYDPDATGEEERDQIDVLVLGDLMAYAAEERIKLADDSAVSILKNKFERVMWPESKDKNTRNGYIKIWRKGKENMEVDLKSYIYVRTSQRARLEEDAGGSLTLGALKPKITLLSKKWKHTVETGNLPVDIPF